MGIKSCIKRIVTRTESLTCRVEHREEHRAVIHKKAQSGPLYMLVWDNGQRCIGDALSLARHYFRRNRLLLGLLHVGDGTMIYSVKVRGDFTWQTCGSIKKRGNWKANRRMAFLDYFNRFILPRQIGYTITPVPQRVLKG